MSNEVFKHKLEILIKKLKNQNTTVKVPKIIENDTGVNKVENIYKKERVYTFIDKEKLKKKQNENIMLIEITRPHIENISLYILNAPHCVFLVDKDGCTIETSRRIFKSAVNTEEIVPGICWKTNCRKNNIIGMVLSSGESRIMIGEEQIGPFQSNVSIGIPLKDDNANICGVLGMVVEERLADVSYFTMLMNAAAAINTVMKQISSFNINERVKNMSSMVAASIHDLKNPLTIIQALTKLGSLNTNDGQQKDYFNKIKNQIKNLTIMLDNIMVVNDPEEYVLDSPALVLQEVAEEFKPLCETKNIELSFINNNSSKLMLRRKLFKRAIYNILINAVQVMSTDGKLAVKVYDTKDKVIIEISDTGPGIPEDIQQTLFNPFISKRESGTGLGLYMVEQTIKQIHQGNIYFETERGEGTIFYIDLPFSIKI